MKKILGEKYKYILKNFTAYCVGLVICNDNIVLWIRSKYYSGKSFSDKFNLANLKIVYIVGIFCEYKSEINSQKRGLNHTLFKPNQATNNKNSASKYNKEIFEDFLISI